MLSRSEVLRWRPSAYYWEDDDEDYYFWMSLGVETLPKRPGVDGSASDSNFFNLSLILEPTF